MALNIDKDKILVQQQTGTTPIPQEQGSSSVTSQPISFPKSQGTTAETVVPSDVTKNEPNVDDVIAKLLQQPYDSLTDEQKQIVDGYLSNIPTQPKFSPEKVKVFSEYVQILQADESPEKKALHVMDKYLSTNDANYKALSSEEKEKECKQRLNELKEFLYPELKNKKGNIRLSNEAAGQVVMLCIGADTDKMSLDQIIEMPSEKIKEKLKNTKKSIYNKIIASADLDNKSLTADQKIDKLAEAILKTDLKYQSLSNVQDKLKYKQEIISSFVSQYFQMDISVKELQNKKLDPVKEVFLEVIKDDNEFLNAKAQQQAATILGILDDKSSDKPETQMLVARLTIIANMPTDKEHVSEREIFDTLLSKKEKGENLTKAESDLLNYYKEIQTYKGGDKVLNQPADFKTSDVAIAMFTGENVITLGKKRNDYALKHSDVFEHRVKILARGGAEGDVFVDLIDKYAKEHNISFDEAINKLVQDGIIKAEDAEIGHTVGVAKKDTKLIGTNTAIAASIKNPETDGIVKENLKLYGDTASKDKINELSTNKSFQMAGAKNNEYTDAFTSGINTNLNLTNQDRNDIITFAAENSPRDYGSSFTKSMVKTASAEQQLEYSNYFANQENLNPAIAEGLAAAEQYVDASIKKDYSANIDRVQEKYAGTPEYDNIKTARETGQTSYEREAASANEGSEGKSADKSSSTSSTQTQNASSSSSKATNPQKLQTQVNKLAMSPQTRAIAQQTRALIARLSSLKSENDRLKVANEIADNISRMQKEMLEYDKKQAVKKEEQAKIQKIEEQKAEIIAQKEKEAQLVKELGDIEAGKVIEADLSQKAQTACDELENNPQFASLPPEVKAQIIELRNLAKTDINQFYNRLITIKPQAQSLFIKHLMQQDISVVTHFMKYADKSVVKQLCEQNPALISTLDKNTLLELGLERDKIIKFAAKDQIAGMMNELSKTKDGREQLQEFMNIMDDASVDDSLVALNSKKYEKSIPLPGSDEWFALRSGFGSNRVRMGQDIDKNVPRELWG